MDIEALACGTPVITYDAGGSKEIVSEDTGRVIERGDLEGVIRATEELDSDSMSSACIERGRLFRKQDKYREYYELYQKV